MVWLLASFLLVDLLQIWVHPLFSCPRCTTYNMAFKMLGQEEVFWPHLKCIGVICSAMSRLKTHTEAMNCHENDVLGKPYTLVQCKDKLTRLCTYLFVVLSSSIWLVTCCNTTILHLQVEPVRLVVLLHINVSYIFLLCLGVGKRAF